MQLYSQSVEQGSTCGHHPGYGLGPLVEQIEVEAAIDYHLIPHFPKSTAISHRGRLVCGNLCGLPVMAMEGRFHMYEGYPLKQITLPVRVMKHMGAQMLIVSNAAGGMNPYHRAGDIVVIEDHINLMGDNPLIGINDDRLGPRFPDMCQPYEQHLVKSHWKSPGKTILWRIKACLWLWLDRTWRREPSIVSCGPSALT